MSNNHVIELNGNRYDALTGQIIAGASTPSQQSIGHGHHAPHPVASADGIVTPRRRAAPPTPAHHVNQVHHKQARSHTLMRGSVKKPASNPIHNVTAFRPKPVHPDVPKHENVVTSSSALEAINPHRVARANHVQRSGLVSKFGQGGAQFGTPVTLAEVPVAPSPRHGHHALKAADIPAYVTQDPFEAALRQATSHEQPKPKKLRLHHRIARKLHLKPRTFLLATGGLSALVIAGFLAYTRVPTVAMKVAATKAGVNANLPSYQPAGFSMKGPIATAPGEISVNYKSNSDERDFKVTQKTSAWNSETLLDNFVETTKQASYQTFQSSGRTIYIYDGGNATWVDGGIWYKIEGNKSLNSDQLLRIANSL